MEWFKFFTQSAACWNFLNTFCFQIFRIKKKEKFGVWLYICYTLSVHCQSVRRKIVLKLVCNHNVSFYFLLVPSSKHWRPPKRFSINIGMKRRFCDCNYYIFLLKNCWNIYNQLKIHYEHISTLFLHIYSHFNTFLFILYSTNIHHCKRSSF